MADLFRWLFLLFVGFIGALCPYLALLSLLEEFLLLLKDSLRHIWFFLSCCGVSRSSFVSPLIVVSLEIQGCSLLAALCDCRMHLRRDVSQLPWGLLASDGLVLLALVLFLLHFFEEVVQLFLGSDVLVHFPFVLPYT